MKKNDWILAAAIFFVAVLTFGLQLLKTTDEYSEVEIQVNGELYGRYRLEQDQEIDVNDKNKVLIKDGKVRMEDTDCPDQICVNHRAISRDGEGKHYNVASSHSAKKTGKADFCFGKISYAIYSGYINSHYLTFRHPLDVCLLYLFFTPKVF